MVVALLMLALAGFIAVLSYLGAAVQDSYGSSLEQYIVDNNPQHSGDVERLTVEYNLKQMKREWHL